MRVGDEPAQTFAWCMELAYFRHPSSFTCTTSLWDSKTYKRTAVLSSHYPAEVFAEEWKGASEGEQLAKSDTTWAVTSSAAWRSSPINPRREKCNARFSSRSNLGLRYLLISLIYGSPHHVLITSRVFILCRCLFHPCLTSFTFQQRQKHNPRVSQTRATYNHIICRRTRAGMNKKSYFVHLPISF